MNFTEILTQLNQADLQNRQLDHKFMSTHTFKTKYKNHQKINDYCGVRLLHLSDQPTSNNNNLLKRGKHRYFEDIQKDEIQDANIFGYSTFDYFCYFKKLHNKFNHTSKLLIPKHMKKPLVHQKQIKTTTQNNQQHEQQYQPPIEVERLFMRPKTAIVSRGTPTKRKVHHKQFLGQVEKVATSDNPLPESMKQHYFTEEIFDFNPNDSQQNAKIENIRCNSKAATFYKQFRLQSTNNKNDNKKSHYYLQNNTQNHPKRHLVFQNTIAKFYPTQGKEKKLAKKRRRHLDREMINKEKENFVKGIDQHFENFGKTGEISSAVMTKMGELKSVVYERKHNNKRFNEEIANYTQSIKEKTINPRNSSLNPSKAVVINAQNYNNTITYQSPDKTVSKQTNPLQQQQQHQFLTQPQINQPTYQTSLKPSPSLSIFSSLNPLLLHRAQLPDLQFKYDHNYTPLSHSIFDKLLIQSLTNHCTQVRDFRFKSQQHFNPKSLKKLPKSKAKFYTVWMVDCVTLDWVRFDGVEVGQEGFVYKGEGLGLLRVAEMMMRRCLPAQFAHLMVTRNGQEENNTTNSNNTSQLLVYQTFIHNSDLKYFQGRQIQIHYFKYFLKRFILFDPSIQKKQNLHSSIQLVFQSKVKTPVEFQEFCKEMKIKENMNVIALRNMEVRGEGVSFRSVEISLWKLLADANETVMMIKKELIEGYDWRGVSLKKGINQYRDQHIEHFYI